MTVALAKDDANDIYIGNVNVAIRWQNSFQILRGPRGIGVRRYYQPSFVLDLAKMSVGG